MAKSIEEKASKLIEEFAFKKAKELSKKEDDFIKEKLEDIFIGIKIKKVSLHGRGELRIKFTLKKNI